MISRVIYKKVRVRVKSKILKRNFNRLVTKVRNKRKKRTIKILLTLLIY